MITVTKINDRDIIVNCDLIELIESTPDTTITTTTGKKIILRDSVDDVLEKVVAYKARINKVKLNNEGL
ncbi:MAG: flagellar FlbD family protein [Defluviitaleaceae bacterium]|nr:flagellar FlbD family protein [Defluviitaleaceae bacterium]